MKTKTPKFLQLTIFLVAITLTAGFSLTPSSINFVYAQDRTVNKIPDASDKDGDGDFQELVCPDGYIEIAVSINEANQNCILEGEDNNNPIFIYLRSIIRFLAAGVGIVLLLAIIFAGIRYASAGGNPQAVESAKKLLMAAIGGLIAFIFLAAIINFLIPGGVIQ